MHVLLHVLPTYCVGRCVCVCLCACGHVLYSTASSAVQRTAIISYYLKHTAILLLWYCGIMELMFSMVLRVPD